jgi:RNA recognition motif-containing protein
MKLFVGNLSFKAGDNDLEKLFSDYGAVTSAKVMTDKFTGRSRGFGFVEMQDDQAAQEAISKLNGAQFMDRAITVNEARERTNSDRPGGGGGNRDRRY